jgi:hypothetical protein
MFKRFSGVLVIHSLALAAALILTGATPGAGQQRGSIRNEQLTVSVNTDDGSYSIRAPSGMLNWDFDLPNNRRYIEKDTP